MLKTLATVLAVALVALGAAACYTLAQAPDPRRAAVKVTVHIEGDDKAVLGQINPTAAEIDVLKTQVSEQLETIATLEALPVIATCRAYVRTGDPEQC